MNISKTKYEVCELCGAVGHGNITCHTCRSHMLHLSKETLEALEKCEIGIPIGTPLNSKFRINIENVNKSKKLNTAK